MVSGISRLLRSRTAAEIGTLRELALSVQAISDKYGSAAAESHSESRIHELREKLESSLVTEKERPSLWQALAVCQSILAEISAAA